MNKSNTGTNILLCLYLDIYPPQVDLLKVQWVIRRNGFIDSLLRLHSKYTSYQRKGNKVHTGEHRKQRN